MRGTYEDLVSLTAQSSSLGDLPQTVLRETCLFEPQNLCGNNCHVLLKRPALCFCKFFKHDSVLLASQSCT